MEMIGKVTVSRLAHLFPDDIVTVEHSGEGDPSALLPAEASHVQGAVSKRVREFAAGRSCARRALTHFGIYDFPLVAMDDRRPKWPEGIVGSITHTDGFCGAAIGSQTRFRGIGLDVEINGRVTDELYTRICTEAELARLRLAPPSQQAALAALIFSAKEAFYKCQFPLTGEWLDFHDVALDPDGLNADEGNFRVVLQRNIRIEQRLRTPLQGRFVFVDRFVMTGMYLPD